ncbi:putative FIKK kinase [Cardiosporidium cionae]|uniref:non-specific serine/threonine protein kinase n=1 Tax=Cardiosporidium cionae TaxID=476202 RepID=A0ABQ7J6P0_9APIC|nr:putative FIKK kinase [Cardiosporidium cionae]|eukprot:KAF8819671.1 putative FIKK kinase [Cardiosporidium cionae]
MDHYNGDYVTDGENFVMEAAVLTYFKRNKIGLAPHLVAILEEFTPPNATPSSQESSSCCGYVCIVSELYGEDLLYYVERRLKEERSLLPNEKRLLQRKAMEIVTFLHERGLCHLDVTPENILIGPQGMKLCDFGKTTPIYSSCIRHLKEATGTNTKIPFESCEPTIGKAAYMPPECWKVYRLLEDLRIHNPLEDLRHMTSLEKRKAFYFRVEDADVFMLGILMFWIWSGGCIWKYSDPQTDFQFQTLVNFDMNVDAFHECRKWPIPLKDILKKSLSYQSSSRENLQHLIAHRWWKYPVQQAL